MSLDIVHVKLGRKVLGRDLEKALIDSAGDMNLRCDIKDINSISYDPNLRIKTETYQNTTVTLTKRSFLLPVILLSASFSREGEAAELSVDCDIRDARVIGYLARVYDCLAKISDRVHS